MVTLVFFFFLFYNESNVRGESLSCTLSQLKIMAWFIFISVNIVIASSFWGKKYFGVQYNINI